MGRMLVDEGRYLWRFVRERLLLLGLVVPLLGLFSLPLQRPMALDLDVGASLEPPRMNSFHHLIGRSFGYRVGREFELAFWNGVYEDEQGKGFTFRWTEPVARLTIRGVPKGAVVLFLRMHGAAVEPATRVQLRAGSRLLAEFEAGPTLRDHTFVLSPSMWSGDVLAIDLVSTVFRPGGEDPRSLGVALDQVTLRQRYGVERFMISSTALLLVGSVILVYLGLCRAGVRPRGAQVVGLLLGLLLWAGLHEPARLFVSAYAGKLFLAAAVAYPVLVLTLRAVEAWFKRSGSPPGRVDRRWLAVLFLVSFLLHFGGALSPRFAAHDAVFHVHRLQAIELGDLFMPHVSAEWGNDPYPGTFYLLAAPLTLLTPDRVKLLAFLVGWVNSSGCFLVWFLAREVLGPRAGRWAALLYVAFPIGLSAYWAGIYSNLFAYWLLLLVAAAVIMALRGQLSTSLLTWVPFFALSFLSHVGMLVLWVPLALLWGVFLWRPADRLRRARLKRLFLAWGIALLLALLVYYSYFAGIMKEGALALFQERVAPEGEMASSMAQSRIADLQVWWRWGAVVDYAGLGLFLGGLGLFGVWWRGKRLPAGILLLTMVLLTVPFWMVSRLTFVTARYMLFLLPVLSAACAGVLAAWWQRGRAGRLVSGLVLGYISALTLAIWIGVCFFGLRPPHVF